MIKVNIDLEDRSYPIYITNDYNDLAKKILSARLKGKIVIITDENVDKFQYVNCESSFSDLEITVYKYVILTGEKNKNLDTVKNIYKYLSDIKADRNTTLVALGGGVVGDITGFVAATFLRGINFVQVPTSLLSQVDSSVGGKVGVDFEGSKNLIGAFYQPKFVYINTNSLKTLPEREFSGGLAEVIKHGIIRDLDFFEYIEYNANKILACDESVLQYIIKVNCLIKGGIVQQDEKENNLREILNFGHTIGHAIESVMEFKLIHGECITLGMICVFKIAEYLKLTNNSITQRVIKLFETYKLPTTLSKIDVDAIYKQMSFDKKIKDNKFTFILPKKIGEVIKISLNDEELIKNSIKLLEID